MRESRGLASHNATTRSGGQVERKSWVEKPRRTERNLHVQEKQRSR